METIKEVIEIMEYFSNYQKYAEPKDIKHFLCLHRMLKYIITDLVFNDVEICKQLRIIKEYRTEHLNKYLKDTIHDDYRKGVEKSSYLYLKLHCYWFNTFTRDNAV